MEQAFRAGIAALGLVLERQAFGTSRLRVVVLAFALNDLPMAEGEQHQLFSNKHLADAALAMSAASGKT